MRTSNEVETFSNLLFIDGMAESLEVDPYQVVVRDKSAGSTIVIFEVQPPASLEWFKEEKDVNRMVDTLRGGDVKLHSSFGAHTVLEITIPVNVEYSDDESSNAGLSLELIIGICVGSFAVMAMIVIGVAYYMVREKEGRPEDGAMDSPLMASKVHPLPQSSSSSPPPPLPDGAQVTTSPFMDTSNENSRPESSSAEAVSEGVISRNPDELTPLQSFHEEEAAPMNVDPTATSAFTSQDHGSSASGAAQLRSAGEGDVKIAPMPLAGGIDLATRSSRLIPGNDGQPMRAPAFLAPL